jgi:DNA polymerase I-like protein with 3'-5' exonuclease and polymerase domains
VLDKWIAEARANGLVALDTETDGRDCVNAKLVGISLATECGKACYMPAGAWRARPSVRAARADPRPGIALERCVAAHRSRNAQDRPQLSSSTG